MSKNICIAVLVMSIFCSVTSLCPGDERHKKVQAFLAGLMLRCGYAFIFVTYFERRIKND